MLALPSSLAVSLCFYISCEPVLVFYCSICTTVVHVIQTKILKTTEHLWARIHAQPGNTLLQWRMARQVAHCVIRPSCLAHGFGWIRCGLNELVYYNSWIIEFLMVFLFACWKESNWGLRWGFLLYFWIALCFVCECVCVCVCASYMKLSDIKFRIALFSFLVGGVSVWGHLYLLAREASHQTHQLKCYTIKQEGKERATCLVLSMCTQLTEAQCVVYVLYR